MEASMNPKVSIGNQNFEKLRKYRAFYVDKTDFIREWWENPDEVTLITRPRRFGKTLNLSMMECFFQRNLPEEEIYLRICLSGSMRNTGNYRGLIL